MHTIKCYALLRSNELEMQIANMGRSSEHSLKKKKKQFRILSIMRFLQVKNAGIHKI